jgi:hypothetical protein
MKILIIVLLATISAHAVNYSDAAFEIGFRQQNGTVTGGADEKAKTGYQVGVSGTVPITDVLSFRSGLFYVEKSIEVDTTPKTELKFTYFQVPVTLMAKLMDNMGLYAGVNVEFNLGDDCTANSCDDVESMTTPFVLGAAFKFAPQLGANLFFESGSGKVAEGIKDFKAVGVNLMITFD